METISIPLSEYIELIDLYKRITLQLEKIESYRKPVKQKTFDVWEYCGAITLQEDPLIIQKQMRDEWD